MRVGSQITVLGAGSWGSALANVLVENGHKVLIWTRDEKQKEEINTDHTNQRYLPHFKFPAALRATTHLEEAVSVADLLVFVIPTKGMRELAKRVNSLLKREVTVV